MSTAGHEVNTYLAERNLQRTRRIWMLDRHADVVNSTTRESLGSWIRGRLKNGVEARKSSAERELSKIKASINELREQWSHQREAQLSVKNRAPLVLFYPSMLALTLST